MLVPMESQQSVVKTGTFNGKLSANLYIQCLDSSNNPLPRNGVMVTGCSVNDSALYPQLYTGNNGYWYIRFFYYDYNDSYRVKLFTDTSVTLQGTFTYVEI